MVGDKGGGRIGGDVAQPLQCPGVALGLAVDGDVERAVADGKAHRHDMRRGARRRRWPDARTCGWSESGAAARSASALRLDKRCYDHIRRRLGGRWLSGEAGCGGRSWKSGKASTCRAQSTSIRSRAPAGAARLSSPGRSPAPTLRPARSPADLDAQCRAMFANVRRVIEAAGGTPEDIVKMTVWISRPRAAPDP